VLFRSRRCLSPIFVPAGEAQPYARLYLAPWTFCFPVLWGFSSRFLRSFLGLARPEENVAYAGLGLLSVGALGRVAQRGCTAKKKTKAIVNDSILERHCRLATT